MKPNSDIIRELLLILEEEMTLDGDYKNVHYPVTNFMGKENLKGYDHKDVIYNVKFMSDKGLIEYVDYKGWIGVPKNMTPVITKITPSGHEFSEAIKKR